MRRINLIFAVLILVLIFPLQVFGVESHYSLCVKKADGVLPDMVDCENEEFDKLDKQLNQNYQRLLQVLKNEEVSSKTIVNAQIKWLLFRDSNCETKTIFGGQNANLFYAECMKNMTKDRSIEIKDFIKFIEWH